MLIHTIDAALIRRCFLAGAKMLDANKDEVNELNVFPVPDGDTGTNMTMTIMSAAREVAALPEEPEMNDIGILVSTDPVALDQACIDLIYQVVSKSVKKEKNNIRYRVVEDL